MKKRRIVTITVIAAIVLILATAFFMEWRNETRASDLSIEEANNFVNEAFDKMAKNDATKLIAEKNNVTVKEISYGDAKDIILKCTVETVDAYAALKDSYDMFLSSDVKKKNGSMFKSALDFKQEFNNDIVGLLKNASEKRAETEILLYDTYEGLVLYASDDVVNIVYGGLIDVKKEVSGRNTYKIVSDDGTVKEYEIETKNVTRGFTECISPAYSNKKIDTSGRLGRFINGIKRDFNRNFIEHDRWVTIFKGLGITLEITFVALIIGVVLGFLVAFIRCAYVKSRKKGFVLTLFNSIAQIYLTLMRGTPVVVQILIIHFVILMPLGVSSFVSAFLCFGLNSGAYVAEIVRGGIMSVDEGQMEAGRSLGFNYFKTMWYIIFPQAFKAVLPALANEFVVLLKETSIAFYIGLGDLMYSVNAIRAVTYSAFMPLIASAVIYLVMVMFFSKMVGILERRLRNSER